MLFTNTEHRNFAKDPAVVHYHGCYYLYHSVFFDDGGEDSLGISIATSTDLEHWTIAGDIPHTQPCECHGTGAPAAIVLDDVIHLFYQTYGNLQKDAICHATSTDGLHFVKDETNPIWSPTNDWCCGRAIDADIVVFHGKLYMYFATRDHAYQVQKLGGCVADLDSGFGRGAWTQLVNQSILAPEMEWEQICIEAPATIENNGQLFLFYGGAYNCKPQQIGVAISDDGVLFRRIWNTPFMGPGPKDAFNACESGHPYAFRDDDGRAYLFYQGSPDFGKTWYLSKVEIAFNEKNEPYLVK